MQAEISRVLDCGVAASRIIYANPTKYSSHLRYARDVGVSLLTADCAEELLKIQAIYPEAE